MQTAVHGDRGRLDPPDVSLAAPAVFLRVAVQDLPPEPSPGDPQAVVVAGNRGERNNFV